MDLSEQYERLLRYCYMKTGNRELAEDITQEAFLRFWKAHTYRDIGKELAYLYTIAKNLCAGEFRRPHLQIVEVPEDLPAGCTSAPDLDDDVVMIQAAMSSLPEEIREMVLLRYVNDLSVTEIGKIMNMSRFSVHRKLRYALSDLRGKFEEGK